MSSFIKLILHKLSSCLPHSNPPQFLTSNVRTPGHMNSDILIHNVRRGIFTVDLQHHQLYMPSWVGFLQHGFTASSVMHDVMSDFYSTDLQHRQWYMSSWVGFLQHGLTASSVRHAVISEWDFYSTELQHHQWDMLSSVSGIFTARIYSIIWNSARLNDKLKELRAG